TEDLKAVAIADGPKVEFVAGLDEARCASCPVGSSISLRGPRERSRQESFAQRRRLPVRDLFRMMKIANVEDAQTGLFERASKHCRIVLTVEVASFGTVPVGVR